MDQCGQTKTCAYLGNLGSAKNNGNGRDEEEGPVQVDKRVVGQTDADERQEGQVRHAAALG